MKKGHSKFHTHILETIMLRVAVSQKVIYRLRACCKFSETTTINYNKIQIYAHTNKCNKTEQRLLDDRRPRVVLLRYINWSDLIEIHDIRKEW